MAKDYFTNIDGWLFATLKLMNKRKLKLNSILTTGDILNHSVFSLEEINNGLSRLESEGFIEFINNKMILTGKAKNFIKSNHRSFESSIEEQVRYSEMFKKMPLQNETTYKEYFNRSNYDLVIKNYN